MKNIHNPSVAHYMRFSTEVTEQECWVQEQRKSLALRKQEREQKVKTHAGRSKR